MRLRSGNKHTAHKATSFIFECLSRLPGDRLIHVRLDAGFYCHEVVECLLEKALKFSISAKLTSAFRNAIESLPADSWKLYPWEEDTEWTEFSYRPNGWPAAFRMIVKRAPFYEGTQRIIGEFFYTPVITNRRGAGSSVLKHHLASGGKDHPFGPSHHRRLGQGIR